MNQKFTKKQQEFIKKFVDIAYHSALIENEAPFSRAEAHRRYRQEAVDLIVDGTYKRIKY